MGKILYREWLKEEKVNVEDMLLHVGIDGLLFSFERWLEDNGYLIIEK